MLSLILEEGKTVADVEDCTAVRLWNIDVVANIAIFRDDQAAAAKEGKILGGQ